MSADAPQPSAPPPPPPPIKIDWEVIKVIAEDAEEPLVEDFCSQIDKFLRTKDAPYAETDEGHFVRLIGAMCSCGMRADLDPPFVPFYSSGKGRSFLPSDIHPMYRPLLSAALDACPLDDLRARIGDCLWVAGRDVKAARVAVRAYKAVVVWGAAGSEDAVRWNKTEERLRRALNLGKQINDRDGLTELQTVMRDLVKQWKDTSEVDACADAMGLLLEHRMENPAVLATTAEQMAERIRGKENLSVSARYYQVAVAAAEKGTDEIAKQMIRHSLAEAIELQAVEAETVAAGNPAIAQRLYEEAFRAYRKAGATQDIKERIHRKVLELQKRGMQSLGSISVPFDGEALYLGIEKLFLNKSPIECLSILVSIGKPPGEDYLRERLVKQFKDSPIMSLIPMVQVDDQGRRVGVLPGLDPLGEDAKSEAFQARMRNLAAQQYTMEGSTSIDYARMILNGMHSLRIADWHRFLMQSDFVPPGHEVAMARALHFGMRGQWLECVHILAPQLEACLRHLLEQSGVIVSSYKSDQTQPLVTMTAMFDQHYDKISEILGAPVAFALQILCVDNSGPNLRNEVCHGLVGDEGYEGGAVIYLWWLTLRLCLITRFDAPSSE